MSTLQDQTNKNALFEEAKQKDLGKCKLVPLKIRERLSSWDKFIVVDTRGEQLKEETEKCRKYLIAFADTGTMRRACEISGVSLLEIKTRLSFDGVFRTLCDDCGLLAYFELRDEAYERARYGAHEDMYNKKGEKIGDQVVKSGPLLVSVFKAQQVTHAFKLNRYKQEDYDAIKVQDMQEKHNDSVTWR